MQCGTDELNEDCFGNQAASLTRYYKCKKGMLYAPVVFGSALGRYFKVIVRPDGSTLTRYLDVHTETETGGTAVLKEPIMKSCVRK